MNIERPTSNVEWKDEEAEVGGQMSEKEQPNIP